jgi:hypothetical protein
MAHNAITINGETFERKGKRMPYVTVFEKDNGEVRVEWAGSLELAQKNAGSHVGRWNKAKSGITLAYPWDSAAYLRYSSIRVEATEEI